jgi:glucose/arabinose dehydrogenase
MWWCLALAAQAQPGPVRIGFEPVLRGLEKPVDIAFPPDGTGRMFIVEQQGKILVYDGNDVLPKPFLNLTSVVDSTLGERGLKSLAFHPNFASNGYFYVHYIRPGNEIVLERYQMSSDLNLADPNSGWVLFVTPFPFAEHTGGKIIFGPDGYLYVAIGDGGGREDGMGGWDADPFNYGQDLEVLLGKILRLDVDGGFPNMIPPTNPFVGVAGVRGEIWAYGLRNPWRISFDRLTGDLFIADVGEDSREEVDFQAASSPGGENYGWRRMEGSACFEPPTDCNDGTLTLPIIEYEHFPVSFCNGSITGGYRYRGDQFPQLYGTYFYGDFCTGQLWGAIEEKSGFVSTELLNTDQGISAFGESSEGELYLANYFQGTISHLVVTHTAVPVLANVSPSSIPAGHGPQNLAVEGDNFVPGSIVRWNSTELTAEYMSRKELAALVPTQQLARGGQAEITVFNPPPGGGTSDSRVLTVADFSMQVDPARREVKRGEPTTAVVTLSPQFGPFEAEVALSCENPPAGLACSFSPSWVVPGAEGASVQLEITFLQATRATPNGLGSTGFRPYELSLLLALSLLTLLSCVRKQAGMKFMLFLGLLLGGLVVQAGCASRHSPPASKEMTVTILGSSSSLEHSTTLELSIQ